MNGFDLIKIEAINHALQGETRQYLTGNLKMPQKLNHIHDEKLEVGITNYVEPKEELPHYHTVATEYQYVLSGKTTYYNVETKEEMTFYEGDFYVIYPNTTYAQKSIENTKILFIKNPSINDKMNVEVSDDCRKWFEKLI